MDVIKKLITKWWFWVIAVAIVMVVIYIVSPKQADPAQGTVSLTTAEKIESAAKKDLTTSRMEFVKCDFVGLETASVWLKPKTFWDEDHFVTNSCVYATTAIPEILKIQDVKNVTLFFQTKMSDGDTKEVLKIIFTRETASKINFEELPVATDYNTLLNAADEIYIYPGMRSELKDLNLK